MQLSTVCKLWYSVQLVLIKRIYLLVPLRIIESSDNHGSDNRGSTVTKYDHLEVIWCDGLCIGGKVGSTGLELVTLS